MKKEVLKKGVPGAIFACCVLSISLLHAETERFRDWGLVCEKNSCSARSYKIEMPLDGYPSLKIVGKTPASRKLIIADAEVFDGNRPIRIQIDGETLFHLSPDKDFTPVVLKNSKGEDVNAGEYIFSNRKVQKQLLLAMLKGGKMWITYTNIRGEIRYPKYSLLGMTAVLKALDRQ